MNTQAPKGNIRSRAVLSLIASLALWAEISLEPGLALADDSQEIKRHAVASQTSWTGFAVLAALLSGIITPPKANQGDTEDRRHIVTRSSANYKVPDVKLVDESGEEASLRTSLDSGGPVMLNFIFTTCSTICPAMTTAFSQVQSKLDPKNEPVKMVSIFIDPEDDTPAMLREYAKKYNAGPHWKMLTGTVENRIAVQRAFGVYRKDKMDHEPVTFLRANKSKPWIRLEGLANAGDLLKEYRQLVTTGK